MTEATPVGAAATKFVWPEAPYKGLNYYGAGDHPLFAGRDDDIVLCARSLGDHGTRLLLLHGLTGCGKSSFLRAGLIPYLEGDAGGFQFLRDADPAVSRALFVRSTHAPLQHVAKAIYELASRGLELRTPRGPRTVDLAPVRLGHTSLERFCDDVSGNVERMHEALAAIGDRLPRTLVLVIDQGEEVLTMRPSEPGNWYRLCFFEFLANLSQTDLDLRIVVALRTEYYGRFRHQLQTHVADPAHIRDFYLSNLDRSALVQAIERPSLDQPLGVFGAPRAQYRFSYEPGLPERIAADLEAASPEGGILPAMQIVCERLYRRAQDSANEEITAADYEQLGGVGGQMHAHLNDALRQAIERLKPQLSTKEWRRERARWKDVLSMLVKSQVDGSVTTELRREDEMVYAAKRARCRQPFGPIIEVLCSDELRICRRIEIMRRDMAIDSIPHNDEPNRSTICYSLGHDAIGLALKQWEDARMFMRRRKPDWGNTLGILVFPVLLAWAYTFSPVANQSSLLARVFCWSIVGIITIFTLHSIFWDRIVISLSPETLARIWRITDKTATPEKALLRQQNLRRILDIYGS